MSDFERDMMAVGSDIDIDDILRPRRVREIAAVPERTPAEIKRDQDRADMDKAAGNAIGRVWSPPE